MRTKSVKRVQQNETNKPQSNEVYLILDNIRSIYNVGAILRTADAAGVKKIYLCGITGYPSKKDIKEYDNIYVESPIEIIGDTAKINYLPTRNCYKKSLIKRIKKTALLASNNTNFEYKPSTIDAIQDLKKTFSNLTVFSIEQAQTSMDYSKAIYNRPLVLIVGNEITGLNNDVINNSNHVVEIKMRGKYKSLNVSTALAIVLFKSIEINSLF